MPDIHAGKGSTIGTTIKQLGEPESWKVSPNIVGSDIGCGVMMWKLQDDFVDLEQLDKIIHEKIPNGFHHHLEGQDDEFVEELLKDLTINADLTPFKKSLGTLGGGNHFIELGKDECGNYWLSVHSGSRNLGGKVASYHQKQAIVNLKRKEINIDSIISELKATGRHKEIQATIEKLKSAVPKITSEMEMMATLEGAHLQDYLLDMKLAQEFAKKSRETMLTIIVDALGLSVVHKFDSIHNFIDEDGTIRKGATSAKKGEELVIPLNMRDGSIIGIGKGNEDWNNSAPHGAGRLMSRTKAKNAITLEDFKNEMKEVYSSSIVESTLDEAPGAYKPAKEILEYIKPTVDVLHIVKPVYNFKAK